MYLRHKSSGDMVEVLEIDALIDPFKPTIKGRFHAGEELQDPTLFEKKGLAFPSGEGLPRCWLDPKYRADNPAGH